MGDLSDPMVVCDPQLRVRGVSGLRVADASIFPFQLSGNINAPSIMTGERCGELVLADWLQEVVSEAEEKVSARL